MWDPGDSHRLWSFWAVPLSCISHWSAFSVGKLEVNWVQRKSFGVPAHSQRVALALSGIRTFLVGAQRSLFSRKNYLLHTKNTGDHFSSKYCCEGLNWKLRGEENISSIPIVVAEAAQTILVTVSTTARKTRLSPWCRWFTTLQHSLTEPFPSTASPQHPKTLENGKWTSQELLSQLVWLSPFPQHTHHGSSHCGDRQAPGDQDLVFDLQL